MITANIVSVHKLRPDEGATSAEYAIMASLVAAVIVVTVSLLGIRVFELFDSIPAF